MTDAPRIPPNSLDAEHAVIGACLADNEQIPAVARLLKPEYFYSQKNNYLFKAILHLFEKGSPVDLTTLSNLLDKKGKLAAAGGSVFLITCIEAISTPQRAAHYAEMVRESYKSRRLVEICSQAQSKAFDGTPPSEINEFLASNVFELRKSTESREQAEQMPGLMYRSLNRIRAAMDSEKPLSGIDTGFELFNRCFHGWQKKHMIIIGGRPKHGKTTLAMQLALNVAKQGIPVLVPSLEMSADDLGMRLLASKAEIPRTKMEEGDISDGLYTEISVQAAKLSNLPITIIDKCSRRLDSIIMAIRSEFMRKQYGLIIIDYLQLISTGQPRVQRYHEVALVCHALCDLDKELDVPMLVLSQIGRDVENSGGKKKREPNAHDLKESGAIEEDTDGVIIVYRPCKDGDDEAAKSEAIIKVCANRHGPDGRAEAEFLGWCSKFREIKK